MDGNLVFSDKWILDLERHYGKHSQHERPGVYFVATADEYSSLRSEIENWVKLLNDDHRKKIIPRLRSKVHFRHTYNELAAGDVLRRLGYKVEYEKLFRVESKEFTPDWYALRLDGCELVVEVFTLNPSIEAEQVDNEWKHLLRRIKEIKSGVVLGINPKHTDNPPSQKEAKQVLTELRAWLETNPDVQQEKSIDRIEFTIISKNPADQQTQFIVSPAVFTVNVENLRDV